MPSVHTAAEIFDQNFLEVRAKLLELAASLDRIERADSDGSIDNDARRRQIQQSLEILSRPGTNRAEQIQLIFSDLYDPEWTR